MKTGLNDKQRQIIDLFGEGQAVIAGAGCGKTTTLVAKCEALLARKPEARFCAVSFTEKSVRDLKQALLKKIPNLDPHWVKTIHGLSSSIIGEFPMQAGLQGGERILIEDESMELWKKSLRVLWASNENPEISEAVDRLLMSYHREQIERLLLKLRSLKSFGVETWIQKSFHRPEVKDLWTVFESVFHRYHHSKNRDGSLDFNDLEVLAEKALSSAKVRAHYHSRFDLVLVDEFQDTNPMQGSILEKFAKPKFTNLCIVGDPKQSIYRFRDADVSVFQDLTAMLPNRHLLDTNYRSRPEIIEFVNKVCAPVFEASELPYEALEAGRASEDSKIPRVSRIEYDSHVELAQYFADLHAANEDLSEYVILVRSIRKDKTQSLLDAFDEKGVPYLLGSGGRFYADPRVQELICFLKGWISPFHSLSQVTALRAPWIGVSSETLYEWAKLGKNQYYEHFFKECDVPVARALKELYFTAHRQAATRPGQILEMLLQIPELDPELYVPLVSLWHKAEELSRQGHRFEVVMERFMEAIEIEKLEKEIPAPETRGMLRVMTVHSSKGLQFPKVVLYDFDGTYRSAAAGDLIWDRKRGAFLKKRDDEGELIEDDPENDLWADLEKRAAIAESKRVFYVALTRAQEELILVWKREVKKLDPEKQNPLMVDSWRAWVMHSRMPDLRPSPKVSLGAALTHEVAPFDGFKKIKNFDSDSYRPRHSPSEWMILNQCALRYSKKFGIASVDDRDDPKRVEEIDPADSFIGTKASVKGEKIHALLETESWDELKSEFKDGFGAAIVEKTKKILNVDAATTVYRELGFEIPLSDVEALAGMMDRLEINLSTRTIVVIDYKFTLKKKTGEELLANYLLQLKLYVYAASKLVNFIPSEISAKIVHFTDSSVELVDVPASALQIKSIEQEIQALFQKSKNQSEPAPTPGSYCKFCEIFNSCDAASR